MNRRSLALSLLVIVALALPLSASQFVNISFDRVARQSAIVVRATVGPVESAWDDAGEIIYSRANLEVSEYVAGSGPKVLRIREVGGTVDKYTQEAIGFPELREGEQVVLFLSRWDDGDEWRIEAYNQGKYLVKDRGGKMVLMPDSKTQGHSRLSKEDGTPAPMEVDGAGSLTMEEFTEMVTEARRAGGVQTRTPEN